MYRSTLSDLHFRLLPSMATVTYVSAQKTLEPSPKPSSVQCPHGHSFTDCACRIIRLAETDCDGPIKRKIFDLARAFGHKRRFTMRYPNGDRVGLPMLDAACRSQTDGRPMPRIPVQREENVGEACRVLRYQMSPLGAITTAQPDGG